MPIRDLNIEWLRNTIGVVSQEPVLFAATIEENLRMGNEMLTDHEMIQACIMANAHEFITKLPRVCCVIVSSIVIYYKIVSQIDLNGDYYFMR